MARNSTLRIGYRAAAFMLAALFFAYLPTSRASEHLDNFLSPYQEDKQATAKLLFYLRDVGGFNALWNEDGSIILIPSSRFILVYDTHTLEILHRLPHRAFGLLWNHDETELLSWSSEEVKVWDTVTWEEILSLPQKEVVIRAQWGFDETRLLVLHSVADLTRAEPSNLTIWNAQNGQLLSTLALEGEIFNRLPSDLGWTGNQDRFLSWGDFKNVRIWELHLEENGSFTAEITLELPHVDTSNGNDYLDAAEWSSDEKRILSWSGNSIKVWDAQTGENIYTISDDNYFFYPVQLSPNNRYILGTDIRSNTFRVWNFLTGAEVFHADNNERYLNRAIWDTNGDRILSSWRHEGITELSIWNVETWTENSILTSEFFDFNYALWSKDGNRLLLNMGNILQVWIIPQENVCLISTQKDVNLRNGPGINFELTGLLPLRSVVYAIGQNTDTEGFLWWKLDIGEWVRADVVEATGDCNTLPQIEDLQ
ncbi:MAG: hypothetical protein HY862_15255 [Chloroflexi bacterium]|nr:hypothetical protein [Chloroflexota bacterium]